MVKLKPHPGRSSGGVRDGMRGGVRDEVVVE